MLRSPRCLPADSSHALYFHTLSAPLSRILTTLNIIPVYSEAWIGSKRRNCMQHARCMSDMQLASSACDVVRWRRDAGMHRSLYPCISMFHACKRWLLECAAASASSAKPCAATPIMNRCCCLRHIPCAWIICVHAAVKISNSGA